MSSKTKKIIVAVSIGIVILATLFLIIWFGTQAAAIITGTLGGAAVAGITAMGMKNEEYDPNTSPDSRIEEIGEPDSNGNVQIPVEVKTEIAGSKPDGVEDISTKITVTPSTSGKTENHFESYFSKKTKEKKDDNSDPIEFAD